MADLDDVLKGRNDLARGSGVPLKFWASGGPGAAEAPTPPPPPPPGEEDVSIVIHESRFDPGVNDPSYMTVGGHTNPTNPALGDGRIVNYPSPVNGQIEGGVVHVPDGSNSLNLPLVVTILKDEVETAHTYTIAAGTSGTWAMVGGPIAVSIFSRIAVKMETEGEEPSGACPVSVSYKIVPTP